MRLILDIPITDADGLDLKEIGQFIADEALTNVGLLPPESYGCLDTARDLIAERGGVKVVTEKTNVSPHAPK